MTRRLLSLGVVLVAFHGMAFGVSGTIILLRGDANNDGHVDGYDPAFITDYLYGGGPAPACMDAADANDDGVVDVSDSSYLNNYFYLGGQAPRSPFPSCGLDTTSDNLGCNSSACQ